MNEISFEWDENKNTIIEDDEFLEKEFDFSKAVKNPYAKKLQKKITMNIREDALEYFKKQSSESGIPYQTLINLYLIDCADHNKKLEIQWK
jgi:predicted DNA binding CopG/RHH family protein